MNKLFKKIIASLFWLSSRSPIISCTRDLSFDEISFKSCLELTNNYKSIISTTRFSLISLGLGDTKVYFFTCCGSKDKKKFNFFKCLKLDTIQPFSLSKEKYKELEQKINTHLGEASPQDVDITILQSDQIDNEIDYIKHKITSEIQREEKAIFKASAIKYVLLAFLPSSLILEVKNVFFSSYILTIPMVYSVINTFFWIFNFFKVKEYICPSYNHLKEGRSSKKQLLINYYLEWQGLKINSDFALTCTKNVERYFFIFFTVFMISLFSTSEIYSGLKNKVLNTNIAASNKNLILTLKDCHLKEITKLNNTDLMKLNTLLVEDSSLKKIVIGTNNKKNVDDIIKKIDFYNLEKIEKVYYIDNSLKDYEVKIFLIKELRRKYL